MGSRPDLEAPSILIQGLLGPAPEKMGAGGRRLLPSPVDRCSAI